MGTKTQRELLERLAEGNAHYQWLLEVNDAIRSGKATAYYFHKGKWRKRVADHHGGGFSFTNQEDADAFMAKNVKNVQGYHRYVVVYSKLEPPR